MLDNITLNDNLACSRFADFQVHTFLATGNQIELGTTDEHIVIAFRAGLEFDDNPEIAGKGLFSLNVEVALHSGVNH